LNKRSKNSKSSLFKHGLRLGSSRRREVGRLRQRVLNVFASSATADPFRSALKGQGLKKELSTRKVFLDLPMGVRYKKGGAPQQREGK